MGRYHDCWCVLGDTGDAGPLRPTPSESGPICRICVAGDASGAGAAGGVARDAGVVFEACGIACKNNNNRKLRHADACGGSLRNHMLSHFCQPKSQLHLSGFLKCYGSGAKALPSPSSWPAKGLPPLPELAALGGSP